MLDDSFKNRYDGLPFAVYRRKKKDGKEAPIETALLHHHREIEVLAIEDGHAVLYMSGDAFPIKKGDLVLIPPYFPHRFEISDPLFSHCCICFGGELLHNSALQKDLESGAVTVSPILSAKHQETLSASNKVIDAEAAFSDHFPNWEMEIQGNLMLLFAQLSKAKLLTPRVSPQHSSFSYVAINYIRKHYQESITSKDAAAQLYITNSHFCRVFRQQFGICFSEYLLTYRLEQSKVLLRETDESISSVSSQCGIHAFSYYSKKFREHFRLTPSQYRKKNF